VGLGAGVSELSPESIEELKVEIASLRDALARVAVAQVEALNAMADYLGTQGGGAIGIFPRGLESMGSARIARARIMQAAQNTIEVASGVISSDGG